jgi:hypothetical protein
METLDPVEALRLIRKLALFAAGSNELGYLKTTMRDVLVIIDRAFACSVSVFLQRSRGR